MKNSLYRIAWLLVGFILTAGSLRAQTSQCSFKVSTVLIIESNTCEDLPIVVSWLDSCAIDSGILIFYGITDWSDPHHCFAKLQAHHIDTMRYYRPAVQPHGALIAYDQGHQILIKADGAKGLNHTEGIIPVDALTPKPTAVGAPHRGPQTLYVDTDDIINMHGLSHNARFIDLAHKYGFSNIQKGQIGLQGGDILAVPNHLIFGQATVSLFPGLSQDRIRDTLRKNYQLSPTDTIDFFLTDNPSLYHLDLFITYAGINDSGKHQFFIANVANRARFNTGTEELAVALRGLYGRFDSFLHSIYGDAVQLDSVPVFHDWYFISPLNGILSCENGKALYLSPYPEQPIRSEVVQNTGEMQRIADEGFRIISSRVRARKVTIPLYMMECSRTTGGQALHCSMSVLSRKDH